MRRELLPIDVMASVDGKVAVAVLEFHGRESLRMTMRVGAYFTVLLEPKGDQSHVVVTFDDLLVRQLHIAGLTSTPADDSALLSAGTQAIADCLDSDGLPPFTPSGVAATKIDGDAALTSLLDGRQARPSDDEIFAYIAGKVYWSWRFELHATRFSDADARRLGIPARELARVAIAGDRKYWSTNADKSLTPTSRLLLDLPAGLIWGIEQPTHINLGQRLQAPRYESTGRHYAKAVEFLHGENPDFATAVKEIIVAVESLALLVTGRSSGTLGDCIKDLKSRGLVPASLMKPIEGVWGYASEAPGIRHGKTTPPGVQEAEARYAVNIATASIGLLLELDRTQ